MSSSERTAAVEAAKRFMRVQLARVMQRDTVHYSGPKRPDMDKQVEEGEA